MGTERAYSLFEVKSFDEDSRVIEGFASTPELDRGGDIMEPQGAKFKVPMPFLWMHQSDQPIGQVIAATVTPQGIRIKAQIAKNLLPRIDEAWALMKSGLVGGLSIGWRPTEMPTIDARGVRRVKAWEWYETSAVTVPMNPGTTIAQIKSICAEDLAASGMGTEAVARPSAGVSARVVRTSANAGAKSMKPIAERKQAFVAEKQAKVAKMNTLMGEDDGATMAPEVQTEFDTLVEEIKSLDGQLARLETLEQVNKDAAVAVNGATARDANASRGASVVSVTSNLPKGTGFTRYAMALAAGRGSRLEAAEYAKRWDKTTPEVGMVLKAAVTAGTTTDSDWAAPLVVYRNLASEFVELLRPETIIGKLGLRPSPFNVTMPTQTQGGTYGWVGQAKPKPVGELKFGQLSLGMAKAAGIIVLSEELVRSSSPSAEGIVRDDMIAGMAAFLDVQFVDPSVAEVANVSPAAITNGITPVDSTGVTAAAFRADFKTLVSGMIAAGITNLSGATWIMTQTQALAFSLMRTSLDAPEFPGIGMTGGTLLNIPVVASEAVPAEGGSPAGNRIILVLPNEILLADEGGVSIDTSREASLQMNSTPDDPATASTVMVSLWQNNLVGLRAERYINWKRRRDAAVGMIEGAVYTG